MQYAEPRVRPAGDTFLLLEFGDELNLELNFTAQAMTRAAWESGTAGILDLVPFFASLLVRYDPDLIGYEDLGRIMGELYSLLRNSDDVELDSRLLYLPATYLDPWSAEARERYRSTLNPDKEPDPDFVARLNGLDGVEQLIRVHAGTEYWVAQLGFWPGTPFMLPLDPRCRLFAPKYDPPRTFTHVGTIALGGGATGIHPVDSPGGYQIFARTPVPIWDMRRSLAAFGDAPNLLRPTDRVKFIPCSVEEFGEISNEVAAGAYTVNIVGYQKISLRAYRSWAAALDPTERF